MAKTLFGEDLANGTFDWVNDAYSLIVMDDTYVTYNSDTYLSDVSGQQGTAIALTGKEIQSYQNTIYLLADQGGSFGVISGGIELNSLLLIRDTGNPATSYIVERVTSFSVTGLPYTTTGVEVTIDFRTFVGINPGKASILQIGGS